MLFDEFVYFTINISVIVLPSSDADPDINEDCDELVSSGVEKRSSGTGTCLFSD
jgi:hypothetical protein